MRTHIFHGAILLYLNKYCNVLQMYCHVQFYITSLDSFSVARSIIYTELCVLLTYLIRVPV